MLYYINHVVVKKRFHIMVLEETVKNVGFIKYMGAFSVNKNSREILTSLDYAAQLLADPGNLVLIFPQGKLYSNFTGEIVFEKGLNRIMQKAGNSFQTIFAATFIENLQHKKPVATVYLEQGKQIDGATLLTDVRKAYQLHYNSSKLVQTEIVI
ncbi:1-acyl-sn-glycerol-3-phosphate acyltransferase [Mucilaginibacter sp.]|uniref:1-acyl-sn-glycerol-3-phosphate acyltransferase n=1 Tax=Mucilaginibacter sp. TaxID=1882438 RepID=UPI0035BC7D91